MKEQQRLYSQKMERKKFHSDVLSSEYKYYCYFSDFCICQLLKVAIFVISFLIANKCSLLYNLSLKLMLLKSIPTKPRFRKVFFA